MSLGEFSTEPVSDSKVDFFSLFWAGSLSYSNQNEKFRGTGSDGPDWFICNNDSVPVIVVQLALNSIELSGNNVKGLVGLSLFQGLTNT